MLESQPSTSPGTTFGYMVIVGLVLLDAGLFFLLVRGPITLFSVLWGLMLLASLPLLAVLAYWTASLRSVRYHVVGNALLIEWGGLQQVVPLATIQSLQWGHEVAAVSTSSRQAVMAQVQISSDKTPAGLVLLRGVPYFAGTAVAQISKLEKEEELA